MPDLCISTEDAIRRIRERIDAMNTIERNGSGLDYYDFIRWCSTTWQEIDAIYGPGNARSEELRLLGLQNCSCNASIKALMLAEEYHARLLGFISDIEDLQMNSG